MKNNIALCPTKTGLNAFELSELNARLAQMARSVSAVPAVDAIIAHLNWLCQQAGPERRTRYEEILVLLLKAVGEDFSQADVRAIVAICGRPLPELLPIARQQLRDGELEDIHVRLVRVWRPFTDPREHEFAQRCSIALVEAVRLHRLAVKEPPKPYRN